MAISSSTSAATDLANTCWTCEPLERYSELANNFAENISNSLQMPMVVLFGSLCGLWIVLSGIKLSAKQTDYQTIVKEFVYIAVTAVLLGGQGNNLIYYVYSSAISIMGSAADVAFAAAQGTRDTSSGYSGLTALAATGEKAVASVFQVASAICRAGSLMNLFNYAYALALVIPYFLLVVSYGSQVVVAIFRAMMVSIFAPFLFLAFAFGWGRGMAFSGAKTMLASILVLFASTAALALALYGVSTIDINPEAVASDKLNQFASLANADFLVILFLGWMGTAFMAEGTSIANSIAGTALTNAAAGIMTAGAAATAMMAGRFGGRSLNPLTAGRRYNAGIRAMGEEIGGWMAMGGAASGAVGAVAGGAAQLVNKFKNINTPSAAS